MRFCNLICEGPGLTLLVCFTLAESDGFCRCPGTQVWAYRKLTARPAKCQSVIPQPHPPSSLLCLHHLSPVPDNWEKRSNIHSIHILIDCVFSAQINCISSWRVRSCRSNSMLYINISVTCTSSATSQGLELYMENYREANSQRWRCPNADKLRSIKVNGI